ncbi:MAG: hypothetical protein LBG97_00050 [Coriobacteriales bacterium]|nr:hypothetical protein [Coriobacteriales bacterium]
MSKQEKGGFRPPPLGKILWRCGECQTFNAADVETCKKCGAGKVIDEAIAGATYKPITEEEKRTHKATKTD